MKILCAMTDAELIEAWAERRSDSAFSELVGRYVDLVYGSALRQVRDSQLAQDVTQAVFVVLARKGASLSPNVILPGWFFRTTRFVATRALRGEARRRHYEQQAAADMKPQTSAPDSDERAWTEAAPFLDDAIASLPGTDRDAVLLRFFQEQPMRVVGEKLGMSEDAAKKRVSRAVDRLKEFFVRRGIALSVPGVAAVLSRSAAQAAPGDLAEGILAAQAGRLATSASVMTLAALALRQLLWLKVRVPLAIGAAAVAALAILRATGTGDRPVQPVSIASTRTNSSTD